METNKSLFNYCLRLADDSLILGHRLSEMCSRGPMIEEDLALTNIALDHIGRAQAILKYAGEIEGKKRTEDEIAYRREEREYQNHLITEQPNGDFAHVIARQLYISLFEALLYAELEKSKDATLASIASKTLKEVRYHLTHSTDWVVRLGDGTEESHTRMQNAMNALWMYTDELFEMDDLDALMVKSGIGVDLALLKPKWESLLKETLQEATLEMPIASYMHTGSRVGIHSENLGHILCEMQYLQRTYPDAKW
ncbi:MAG: phenylacetate-CoA oxygenase subunit PaaC [Bacteroidia bacterium]|jgi:ring-1,2-phenylacetyl-CoA epoxidase subunit PaaC|nr:phenylacetate-CoA oxygenase subunit PaaC [Bacteroidia bacterium]